MAKGMYRPPGGSLSFVKHSKPNLVKSKPPPLPKLPPLRYSKRVIRFA